MADKIQAIKEEIERLKGKVDDNSSYFNGWQQALRMIEIFIDSLPEEPVSEDLEEEISKWRNHYISVLDNNLSIDLRDIEMTANHFAEWQKQQYEELFSKDSWTYIEENYPDITEEEKLKLYDISIKSRLTGANTIKQQMKKHINNIVSCLEEFLQPGFPIFKAGISEEITWLNSLIIKND